MTKIQFSERRSTVAPPCWPGRATKQTRLARWSRHPIWQVPCFRGLLPHCIAGHLWRFARRSRFQLTDPSAASRNSPALWHASWAVWDRIQVGGGVDIKAHRGAVGIDSCTQSARGATHARRCSLRALARHFRESDGRCKQMARIGRRTIPHLHVAHDSLARLLPMRRGPPADD